MIENKDTFLRGSGSFLGIQTFDPPNLNLWGVVQRAEPWWHIGMPQTFLAGNPLDSAILGVLGDLRPSSLLVDLYANQINEPKRKQRCERGARTASCHRTTRIPNARRLATVPLCHWAAYVLKVTIGIPLICTGSRTGSRVPPGWLNGGGPVRAPASLLDIATHPTFSVAGALPAVHDRHWAWIPRQRFANADSSRRRDCTTHPLMRPLMPLTPPMKGPILDSLDAKNRSSGQYVTL
ncbi:hypothetical protein LshimejAT787_1202170 [Lyophyllum shimeji]|uniref:Uncharacterized protein n=1 Tax=Lyophyllum shimeji TaxID=47721 RepID=A0A9P3PWA6_LYOSH|nr:hypothetical protein LshimejAT787_1202170 [Lyophyllum shimeji]